MGDDVSSGRMSNRHQCDSIMDLHVKCRTGNLVLRVTRPDGLTHDRLPANEYVVKLIEPKAAHAIYNRMDVYNGEKIDQLVKRMPTGWSEELPFLEPIDGHLECRNDAHVLEAMVALGLEEIPVVLHYRHASMI